MPYTMCVVVGCHNHTRLIRRWKREFCSIHKCLQGGVQCQCEPPFHFFGFPSKNNSMDRWMDWVKLVNRKDVKSGKLWVPKEYDRICSDHFLDGKPTDENPNPVLRMGYEPRIKPKRRPLLRHKSCETPIKKHKKENKVSNESRDLETVQSSSSMNNNTVSCELETQQDNTRKEIDIPVKWKREEQNSHTQESNIAGWNNEQQQTKTCSIDTFHQNNSYTEREKDIQQNDSRRIKDIKQSKSCTKIVNHLPDKIKDSEDTIVQQNNNNNTVTCSDSLINSSRETYSKEKETQQKSSDHSYFYVCNCKPCCICEGCKQKQSVINDLLERISELEEKLKAKPKYIYVPFRQPVYQQLLKDDAKVNFYTGLPSLEHFNFLYQFLNPKIEKMRYWQGPKSVVSTKIARKFAKSPTKFGPKRKLFAKDEFLLCLMRLRLGCLNEDVADRFGISCGLASRIFTTWVKVLSLETRPLIYYPPKENIFANLPTVFQRHYPRIRSILDCTEIFIEKPRKLKLQAQTWSDYKKHNTAKILLACTPRGSICFISKAWGGRASDNQITKESGFLDLVDPYDQHLADKGFLLKDEFLIRHAELVIPPGIRGSQQQTPENVRKTKKIANLRIHVERAINRLKRFRIIQGIYPISLIPHIDDIISVCAALCDLHKALVF